MAWRRRPPVAERSRSPAPPQASYSGSQRVAVVAIGRRCDPGDLVSWGAANRVRIPTYQRIAVVSTVPHDANPGSRLGLDDALRDDEC